MSCYSAGTDNFKYKEYKIDLKKQSIIEGTNILSFTVNNKSDKYGLQSGVSVNEDNSRTYYFGFIFKLDKQLR